MNSIIPARKALTAGEADPQDGERASGGRDTILRAAAILFSTKGYAESGLREIAEMAGIRSSTVYYHFASKEQIYEEIIRIAIDVVSGSVTAELKALPPDATPCMRLEAAIAGHLRALHDNKPFTSTNAQSRIKLPDEVNEVIGPMREKYSSFWRAMLEEAKASGWLKPGLEPNLLRPLMLGTLNRTIGWFDPDKGSLSTLIDTTVTMFSGIWKKPAPARPARKRRTRSAVRWR